MTQTRAVAKSIPTVSRPQRLPRPSRWKVSTEAIAAFLAFIAVAVTVVVANTQIEAARVETVRTAAVIAYGKATAAAVNYAALLEGGDSNVAEARAADTDWRVAFQTAFAYGLTEDDKSDVANRLAKINTMLVLDAPAEGLIADVSSATLGLNAALCRKLDPSAECVLQNQ